MAVGADAVHRPGGRRLAARLRAGDGAGGGRPATSERLRTAAIAYTVFGVLVLVAVARFSGHAGLGRPGHLDRSSAWPSPCVLTGAAGWRARARVRRPGTVADGPRAALVVLTPRRRRPRHGDRGARAAVRPRLRRRRLSTGPGRGRRRLAALAAAGRRALRRPGRTPTPTGWRCCAGCTAPTRARWRSRWSAGATSRPRGRSSRRITLGQLDRWLYVPRGRRRRGVPPGGHRDPRGVVGPAGRRLRGGADDRATGGRSGRSTCATSSPATASRSASTTPTPPRGRRCWPGLHLDVAPAARRPAAVPAGAPGAGEPERPRHRRRLRPAHPARHRGGATTWSSLGSGPAGLGASVYAASEGLHDARARARGDRRAGRHQLADPQLPRLQGRDQRQPAGLQRLPAGLGVRQHVPLHALGAGRSPREDGLLRLVAQRRHLGARPHRASSPPAPPGGGSACRSWRRSPAAGSSTARRSPRRRRCAGGTSSSSAAATPPGRRRCTSPRYADRVSVLIRRASLADDHVGLPDPRAARRCRTSTSAPASQVVGGTGSDFLETVTVRDLDTGAETVESAVLFVLIGSEPRTDWAGRRPGPRPLGLPAHRGRSSWRTTSRPPGRWSARPPCWRRACRASSPPGTCAPGR